MFVSEIYDEISEILATTDSNRIYRKLTQAVQGLMDSGHYHHLISQVDVCTGWDGMSVTLPRGIEVPLAVNTDGSPVYFRSRLFQFHINKGGMYSPVSWAWDDRGFVATVMDILQPSQLVAIAEHEADVGVRLRVIGTDGSNRALRSQTEAGEGVDGLYITAHSKTDFPLGLIQPDGINLLIRTARTKALTEFSVAAPATTHNFLAGTLAKVIFEATVPTPLDGNGNYYIGTPTSSTVTLHNSQLDAESGENAIQITSIKNSTNDNVFGTFENARSVDVLTSMLLPVNTGQWNGNFPRIKTGTEVRFEKIGNNELPSPLIAGTVYFTKIIDDSYNIALYESFSDASNDINQILLSGEKNNATILVRNPIAPETTLEFTLDAPFGTGDLVQTYSAGGSLPAPLLSGQNYYARAIDPKNLTLHESYEDSLNGDNPIVFTSEGSGQNSVAKLISAQSSAGKVSNISASGLTIPAASGTGAEIIPIVTGPVTFAAIVSGGGGYPSAPTVSFSDIGGIGYTSAPTVTIESTTGVGSGATAEAVLKTDSATGLKYVGYVTVTNAGTGYSQTSPPTIKFSGGGIPENSTTAFHARASATISNGGISAISLKAYGSGASAQSSINSIDANRPVNAITLTSGGSGYRYTPRIEIQPPATNSKFYFLTQATISGAINSFKAITRGESAPKELLATGTTVPYTSTSTTSVIAGALVTAINANTSTSGFSATQSTNTVVVTGTSNQIIESFSINYSTQSGIPRTSNVGGNAKLTFTLPAPSLVDSLVVTGKVTTTGVVSISAFPSGFDARRLKAGMQVTGDNIPANAAITVTPTSSISFTISPAPSQAITVDQSITIKLGTFSSLTASGARTDLLGNLDYYFKSSQSTSDLASDLAAAINENGASSGYFATASNSDVTLFSDNTTGYTAISSVTLSSSPTSSYEISFSQGFAYAKCLITTNFVSEYEIKNSGSGYTNTPALLVSGTTGSGATASAVVDSATGKITAVESITQGSGYTTIPSVAVSPSTGVFVQFSSTGTLPSPLIQGVTYRAEAPFDNSGTFTVKNIDFSDVNITSSATGDFSVVISRTFGIGFTNNWVGDFSWVPQGMTTYFDTDYSFPKTSVTDDAGNGQISSTTPVYARKLSDSKIAVYSTLSLANNPPPITNTSATSVTPSIALKTFTLNAQSNPIKFKVGQGVSITSVGTTVYNVIFMAGAVVSYTEATKVLVVSVTKISGATNYWSNWQIVSDFQFGLIRPQDLGYGQLYFAVKGTATPSVLGGNKLRPATINYLKNDQVVRFRAVASGSQLPNGISANTDYKIKIVENDIQVYTTSGTAISITGFQIGQIELVVSQRFYISPTLILESDGYLFSDSSFVQLKSFDEYELPYAPDTTELSKYIVKRINKNQFQLLYSKVSQIELLYAGSGYTSPPLVGFLGGGGTGAYATATIANGLVTGITLVSGGSGYTSVPEIIISGGGGFGAAARAMINAPVPWFSTGTNPDLDFYISGEEPPVLVKNVEHIEKPKTSGFISLYAADFGRSNDLTLIGQYHPSETNPKYRRIRLGKKCSWARILYQPKAPKFESQLDYIPVENARAVIAAVHAVDLEDKDFLDQAQRYWQLAMTYLRSQSDNLDGHAMQTPQINNITFGDETDPVMF